MWVCGLDWAGPGQGQVADACECGNEPSGSIKCGEFLDQLQTSQLSKKDSEPCSKYYNVWLSPLFLVCDNLNAECRVYNLVKSLITKPKTGEDTRF